MIVVEALDTLRLLIAAALGWVLALAVGVTLLTLAAMTGIAWAWQTARKVLSGRVTAEQGWTVPEFQPEPHEPSHGHTGPRYDQVA